MAGGDGRCPAVAMGAAAGTPPRSRAQAGRKWRTIGENKAGSPSLALLAVPLGTSFHRHVPLSGFSWWRRTLGTPGFSMGLGPHTAPRRPCVRGAGGHLVSPGAGFPIEKH